MLNGSIKAKRGGVKNRRGLYAAAASHSIEAINVLVKLMRSKNENVSLGAAKALLSKALPDLKATDMNITDSKPLRVYIVDQGFMPPNPDAERLTTAT